VSTFRSDTRDSSRYVRTSLVMQRAVNTLTDLLYREGPRRTLKPPDGVTGADADNVAAYVASVVSKPGKDTGLLAKAVPQAGAGAPAVEKNGTLSIAADPNGQLAYVTNKATGSPGKITVEMPNKSSTPHDIVIDGKGNGQVVQNGGTSRFSAAFTPGNYTYYCSVAGHRDAGMHGTLVVQ